MNFWKRLFSGDSKRTMTARPEQEVKSLADVFDDLYGPWTATADERGQIFEGMRKEMGYKNCQVCAKVACKPGIDDYWQSDIAGKQLGVRRAGATHRAEADRLSALAYAQVHAPSGSFGPKTEFRCWICRDCVLDYWGVIERSDAST